VAEVVLVTLEPIVQPPTNHLLFSQGGARTSGPLLNHNSFIADSGASSHMRFSHDGMSEMEPYVTAVKVGNSEAIYSESRGQFKGPLFN
jgi:hypothetical protein